MRQRIILILLFLATALGAYAQSATSDCPTIEIVGPAGNVMPGDSATFSVNVREYYDDEKLRYRWTVSAGSVESGQNTPVIVVRTTLGDRGELIANVAIDGLSQGCAASAFSTTTVGGNCMSPLEIVEYGRVSPRYELQQIKLAVAEWRKKGASDRLVFILYSDNAMNHKMVDNRVKIISRHLTDLGVSKDNFAIVTPRMWAYRTKIFIIPHAGKC